MHANDGNMFVNDGVNVCTCVPASSPSLHDRYLAFFEDDKGWDAGVSVGLLPALVTLLELDGVRSGGEDVERDDLFVSTAQWILSSLLHGPLRPNNSFAGCNVARCLELFLDTEGAFAALIGAIEGFTARAIHPSVPHQMRGLVHQATRTVLRFF